MNKGYKYSYCEVVSLFKITEKSFELVNAAKDAIKELSTKDLYFLF